MPTSSAYIVMPHHVNGTHRLFGGQLMAWIDVAAAVEARRHSRRGVTTAAVDHLTFLSPAYLDETVRLHARVTRAWRTSLEVRVESYAEPVEGEPRLINAAYLVFVALDADGSPARVPEFTPGTAAEREEWENAGRRREARLAAKR
ncbi:MAG: acyl-CoA thioesterase [Clostridiales bacterium]|jgi:acyl-CoA hydrolase|nr:acyl-CoA thioesterase [Clostridiales bacterium]